MASAEDYAHVVESFLDYLMRGCLVGFGERNLCWGSRKLEDNWRRRNKATFSVDDFNDTGEESDDTGEAPPGPRPQPQQRVLQGNVAGVDGKFVENVGAPAYP